MLLRVDAGFLLSRTDSCIAYLPLLANEYAEVTTTGLLHFFVVTAFDLAPYSLAGQAFNLGELCS
ncbi:hypothetical protein [Endozoicomonas sp. 8E]|uniref:hypothetical protein n=1 Tax=Endozoicomonas sp. 8E TaxID=3035692 RepID=UPI0029394528|nr:hypothetical protein [Endozoicomonas sp. 8E]WOG28449.1 hypothetical protein P6910_01995 [Endozoicomonas sp. 8E]